MSEDAPQFIEDKAKARAMADAEDPYRVAASKTESQALNYDSVVSPDFKRSPAERAQDLRYAADIVGEEVGRQYDAEHQQNPQPDADYDAAGNFIKGTHLGGGPIAENGVEPSTGAIFKGSNLKNVSFGEKPKVNNLENGRYTEIYEFDASKFDQETEEEVRDYVRWAMKSPKWSEPARLAESIRERRQERAELRQWAKDYSGKVPKHWGEVEAGAPWHYIRDDIKNPNVLFDEVLTQAIVDSPYPHVNRDLAMWRKLTPEQLEHLVKEGKIHWDREDIAIQQESFGMDKGQARRSLDIYTWLDKAQGL